MMHSPEFWQAVSSHDKGSNVTTKKSTTLFMQTHLGRWGQEVSKAEKKVIAKKA